MSAWARRRQTLFALTVVALLGLIAFGVYAFFIFQPATCFDQIQNGSEQGVDCGGSCSRICPFQAAEPQIVWARGFEISDGVYNLAGLIQNPNFSAKMQAQYKFEAFNENNLMIQEIFGDITLQPSETKVLFEPTILTGSQNISRVFLRIVGEPSWSVAEESKSPLVVSARVLSDTDTIPKLRATISNTGITPLRDVAVFAALYNREGNVVQASRTFIEYIDRDGQAEAFFTWPSAFTDDVTKIDIFTELIEL